MELRHVRYFLAVAEELNFTRAAAKVGIGQPPLSQQIRSLEHELGTPLFRRLSHGAELTEAGQAFLPEARALLVHAERASQAAQQGAQGKVGRLRVGFTGSAAFCPEVPVALRTFRRKFPKVELFLEEAATAALIERLHSEHLDCAFIRPGRCDPTGVRVYAIGEEPFVAVLPSSHALAKLGHLALSELALETFVLFARQAGPGLFDEVIAACRQTGFEPTLGQEAPQMTSVANLVAAELGISLVPKSISQVQVAGVKYLPITGVVPVARLALVTGLEAQSILVRQFLTCTEVKAEGRRSPRILGAKGTSSARPTARR